MEDSIHGKKPGGAAQDEDSVTLPASQERNLTTGMGAAGKKGRRTCREMDSPLKKTPYPETIIDKNGRHR